MFKHENACNIVTGPKDCQVVLGGYLLNQQKSHDELAAVARGIKHYLAPSGFFIGMMNNPFDRCGGSQYKKYGFSKVFEAENTEDFDGSYVDIYIDELDQPIRNYNFFPESYEQAFIQNGFDIQWLPISLHPSQIKISYWDDFMAPTQPLVMFVAKNKHI